MSPAEDARLLLVIVRRHLRSLRVGLDPAFPEEDWGFTAQQVVEKLLKAWIVLADRRPPRIHELTDLVVLAGQPLDLRLAALQEFAVEARYGEEPLPLPAVRVDLLALPRAYLADILESCEAIVIGLCGPRWSGSSPSSVKRCWPSRRRRRMSLHPSPTHGESLTSATGLPISIQLRTMSWFGHSRRSIYRFSDEKAMH